MADEGKFFRVRNWDKYQNFRGNRAHWLKLSLDFFDDPVIVSLPDSQRLAFIGVLILCGKRANRVAFDATYIKKRCGLRVTPDLALFMAEGLIELDCTSTGAHPALEEIREEKKREEESRSTEAPYVPPDVKAETAIREGTVTLERKLLSAVSRLAGKVTPERDELSIMREVTAYRRGDGTLVAGRANPSGMTAERLEKSLADALGWLADLDKPA